MLAAVENEMPPAATKVTRAREVLERGLTVQPESIELVQAEYLLLASTGDHKGAIARSSRRPMTTPREHFGGYWWMCSGIGKTTRRPSRSFAN